MIFLGYDPGGTNNHGVAAITTNEAGIPQNAAIHCVATAEAALAWLLQHAEGNEPAGLGIDTLTKLCTGDCGWRPADDLLRDAYPDAQDSVASPNSLFGSMGLNGLTVGRIFREQWPKVVISETHPKVLYHAISSEVYREVPLAQKRQALLGWLTLQPAQIAGQINTDDKWDALISAYAAMKGVLGAWAHDLHLAPVTPNRHGRYVAPFGPTQYYWPVALPLA